MSHGIDVRMYAMKLAGLQPSRDPRSAQAAFEELPPTDHPVLAHCELPNPICVGFRPTVGRISTHNGHNGDPQPRNVTSLLNLRHFDAEVVTDRATRLEAVSDEATQTSVEEIDDELATEAEAPEGLDREALERRARALEQVVKFGDPVLRSAASPVPEFDDRLEADAERMIDLMRDAIGVGLAATQLGTLRRMLVFQVGSEAEPTVLVNPEIEWRSDDAATAEEGCLSLPGVVVDVERPLHVRTRAVDVHGEPLTIEASGLEARVIQHEVDHLDGVLMLDRTEKDQRKGALRALREGGTYAPPRPEQESETAEPGVEEMRGRSDDARARDRATRDRSEERPV
jgi:peptide deformylase